MPLFFLSDVHLRLDRPERAQRLARFVAERSPGDRLVIVGDLCDFWYASREMKDGPVACEGLRSLAGFRERGGELTLLPGNHDAWLGPHYEQVLGVGYGAMHLDLDVAGTRFRATHGHTVGAHSPWKAWMKGPAFLRFFRGVPGPLARGLNVLLDSANEITYESVNRKHTAVYRRHADTQAGERDVCVFGHIHRTHDDAAASPRLIILGGWHRRTSYLRVEDDGQARLIVADDPA